MITDMLVRLTLRRERCVLSGVYGEGDRAAGV